MAKLALVAVVLGLGVATSTAHADPLLRFGLTFGIDRNIPEAKEYGPLIGVGLGDGRFSAEFNYSYLSFMDPDTSIHRAAVGLRANIWSNVHMGVCNSTPFGHPCLNSRALYGEIGAARRFGHWKSHELAMHDTTSQNEVNATIGYSLGLPGQASWLLGLRFSVARRDPELSYSCRSTGGSCSDFMQTSDTGGIAESVMLEWSWVLSKY